MPDDQNQPDESVLPGGSLDPALVDLEPAAVWRYFGDLARIPRESGNEAGVRAYIKAVAAQRNVICEENEVGDLLLRVNPNASGCVVGVQAHMDMVCVSRDGAPFDFAREPIRLKRDGDFLRADGTSLGADNGIGIAYALALAEEVDGPLEVLLTVDEEQGFTGIEAVAPGWMRAQFLINLDSEEEGYLTIASAGAQDFVVSVPVERHEPSTALQAYLVKIDGLKGGHSGIDIHRDRVNALKAMGLALSAAKACGGVVYGMRGGNAPNVIPSSSTAVVGLTEDGAVALRSRLAALQRELTTTDDPAPRIDITTATESRKPLTASSLDRLLGLLDQIPSGVMIASPRDPSQPFLSNNLAIVKEPTHDRLELTMMSRSPASAELEQLEGRYRAIAEKNGASVVAGRLVPGWAPDYDSPLLARFQRKHKEQFGHEAKILEIHAGLECGALQGKYPGMDLISVGPDITDVHSPDEKVSVGSTRRMFDLVRAVIHDLHREAPTGS